MAVSGYVVTCTDSSMSNPPVYVNPAGAMIMNRRLVLKQLPGGQFALTVQPLEPDVQVLGGSFVMSDSDTSSCSVTVENSCEPDVSNRHVPVPVCCASCLDVRY